MIERVQSTSEASALETVRDWDSILTSNRRFEFPNVSAPNAKRNPLTLVHLISRLHPRPRRARPEQEVGRRRQSLEFAQSEGRSVPGVGGRLGRARFQQQLTA